MILYVLCGIIAALCIVIILQIITHHVERKDLYDRIMSGSITEYRNEKPPSVKSVHDRILRRWRGKEGENE